MKDLMNVELNNEMTMSSREIAELTGKNHSNVMRDIRSMMDALEQDSNLNSVCKSTSYVGENGQSYPQYELDKDTCLTLLLGYDVVARMKVVKRWQELEQKQQEQFKLPQNYVEALEMLVVAEKEKILLQEKIDNDAPKLEVYEAIAEADSGIRITEFARVLSDKNSIGRNKLYSTLRDWKLLDRNNVPYQRCIEADWFYVVERPFNKGDYSGINFQIFLTGKGQSYIINRLKKENII